MYRIKPVECDGEILDGVSVHPEKGPLLGMIFWRPDGRSYVQPWVRPDGRPIPAPRNWQRRIVKQLA
jgi:hypothetical protein